MLFYLNRSPIFLVGAFGMLGILSGIIVGFFYRNFDAVFLFFSGLLIFSFYLYTKKYVAQEPYIKISEKGITCIKYGLVEWQDILNTANYTHYINAAPARSVALEVKDINKYFSRLTPFFKLITKKDKVYVNVSGLSTKPREISQIIKNYHKRYGSTKKNSYVTFRNIGK